MDVIIWKELKKQENTGTIKKVLPAVEFSVNYDCVFSIQAKLFKS